MAEKNATAADTAVDVDVNADAEKHAQGQVSSAEARKKILVRRAACGGCALVVVAIVIIVAVLVSLVGNLKPVDVSVCYINACGHDGGTSKGGTSISDVISTGDLKQLSTALFECGAKFNEQATKGGSARVYAKLLLENPNNVVVKVKSLDLHMDAVPAVPSTSPLHAVVTAASTKARVLKCSTALTLRKGTNSALVECDLETKGTVLASAIQAYLESYAVKLTKNIHAKVRALDLADVPVNVQATTSIQLKNKTRTTVDGVKLGDTKVAGRRRKLQSIFGNTDTCRGTTDLQLDMPTVYVCGIFFAYGAYDTLTALVTNPLSKKEAMTLSLDVEFAVRNPTSFELAVADIDAIIDFKLNGTTPSPVQLPNAAILTPNATTKMKLRTTLVVNDPLDFARNVYQRKYGIDLSATVHLRFLGLSMRVPVPTITLVPLPSPSAAARRVGLQLGTCLCIYYCDASRGDMTRLDQPPTRPLPDIGDIVDDVRAPPLPPLKLPPLPPLKLPPLPPVDIGDIVDIPNIPISNPFG